MARSIDDIQTQIIASVQADADLSTQLTSTSKRAVWRLLTYVVATAIAVFEQLLDIFKKQLEDTASKAIPGNAAWIQSKVFEFQYDATTPQIVQLISLVPQYPVIDPTKRIITRCSVKTDLSNNVRIKVAKALSPIALTVAEVNALQGYINTIGTAGIYYVVSSTDADQMYVNADIYFAGQYSSVIAVNVRNAIDAYLAAIPFDGVVKISDLEKAIKAVDGVNDVIFKNIRARKGSDLFAAGSDLVLNNQEISRLWNTAAGYVVSEQTTGQTLVDSLNFIAE
jgi:hypothetical protein